MVSDLQKLIQDNTESKVTERFVETIKSIAKIHSRDEKKFVKTCNALGKFKGKEDFLKELLQRINGSEVASDLVVGAGTKEKEDSIHRSGASVANKARTKKAISLSFYESDEEHDFLPEVTPIAKPLSGIKEVAFKRITKNAATQLKEYPEHTKHNTKRRDMVQYPERSDFVEVPTLDSTVDEEQMKQLRSTALPEDELPFTHDIESTTAENIAEDRDWYNDEEAVGHVIPVANIPDEGTKRPSRVNMEYDSEVRLTAISFNERKNLIPPFLRSYNNIIGETVIIGSLDSDPLSKGGLINPFKNPDSEFSINARRGSKIVATRKLQRDRKVHSAQTANIVGTVVGKVLGIKKETKEDQKADEEVVSQSYAEIEEVRKSLPAYSVKSELLQVIRDNQVTVIIGETGSGKTTQLGQYLYEDGFSNSSRMIGITQPRRVAAISVAQRVALEMNVKLGKEVGYAIRFEDKTSADTRIKFMTDGILLREALLNDTLDNYSCIILDEAHERSLNTDILLGILKNLLLVRRDLKLIITSATMNANKFSKFFGCAPQFTIPGRTFPVQVNYTRAPVSDYVEAAVIQAIDIHLSSPASSGDILIFMTGQEDIETTCEYLTEKLIEIRVKRKLVEVDPLRDIEVLPIYSSLPADIQGKVFKKAKSNKRKIVVATNIAETSLTVDGIKYVIDCGYSKLKVYNPRIGLESLAITPISLANANQRSGRAGRTGPGIAYRLYTEHSAVEDMYEQTIPEIQRTNLASSLLLLKSLGIHDLLAFPFMDRPPVLTLMKSLFELWSLEALDNFGNLTTLATKMAKFPLQPSLSKILLLSAKCGCSEEMLIIVSMLSVPQVFYRPRERQNESDQARSRFLIPESDHLTLLNVFAQWKANRFSADWCNKHYLQYRSLRRAYDIKEQLASVMKKERVPIISSGADWDIIRKCICAGYTSQAARKSGLSQYNHLKNAMELKLHPTSSLFASGDPPPYVVYHELLVTSKEYINVVTAVDPFWLMEYGGIFYNIRRVSKQEVYGLYEHDERDIDRKPDDLDKKINACYQSKKVFLDNLRKDTEKSSNLKESQDIKKRDSQGDSSVRIGFKKRKPL
ncbi:DEAH-box RNA helicase PRP16 Ecym_4037 [Eremothecium cymbalariae DBVPG|uniref:Pre-mRNA-splicing factor ATP-dependent RNA helicase PRP16 n=1 Tax=Eremothecium cymbalariae (strain CBS 270.75 / DBVPG 7215 / KCTC 17166 / NRRL Y-17582) TaxID=931890 RepID=G8JSW6_ERECY|nr:hypothetical protein Ecym_4037 [Eremothecium cymbalariae DBVPG\